MGKYNLKCPLCGSGVVTETEGTMDDSGRWYKGTHRCPACGLNFQTLAGLICMDDRSIFGWVSKLDERR